MLKRLLIAFLLLVVLGQPAFAAFSATTQWDIGTGGSSSNGGGFDTSSSGTDFSQQNSPQITYTDLVIGATNTQLTSALNPFTSVDVGNIINITGGTGFTVQRVQIVSVAAGVATCDKSCGTASSTGGTGNLGGSLSKLADVAALPVAGNTVWIKTGTYSSTTTTTLNLTGAVGTPITIAGYNTTHGDNGTAPTLTSATNFIDIIDIDASWLTFRNLKITSTAGTPGDGIAGVTATSQFITVDSCTINGVAHGINGGTRAMNPLIVRNTQISNCTSHAVTNGGSGFADMFEGCVFYNNGGDAYLSNTSASQLIFTDCIIAKNAAGVVTANTSRADIWYFRNCDFVDQTGDAIKNTESTGSLTIGLVNCIFYGNGGWAVNITTQSQTVGDSRALINHSNAYGSNTSGNLKGLSAGTGDVSLSGDPFTNRSGQDYSLNNTSGAGAACRAAGFQGAFSNGTTTGYPDIGAAQHQATGGGRMGQPRRPR
ncbi:MAG TPA: hypothetical protein VFW40_08655 [Capsulimonadaceae bacterium]|nr:hypothetical protein [Capsulimonadaceae bacterium]